MKANEATLLNFLRKASQLIVPIYQRTYSWTMNECEQLWQDIVRCGSSDHIDVHFVGSIVYILDGVSTHPPLLLIDGQQRLTTVSILLATLAHTVQGEPLEGLSTNQINYYYLMNQLESGNKRYKLLLSQTDRDSLIALVDKLPPPHTPSIRIQQNYEFFEKKLKADNFDIAIIWRGLAKLMIVEVALERGKDNPQLIFESMNSTGKELSQADLIRNFILMGLDPDFQTRMYDGYWRKIELDFGQEAYGTHFDGFMRYYLTIKTNQLVREYDVYNVFKDYTQLTRKLHADEHAHIEWLLSDIHYFAKLYCAIAFDQESDPMLKIAFADLNELKADVTYPFLMEVYYDFKHEKLKYAEFLQIVRLTESYVFRRAICNIATNTMNKTFASFTKSIDRTKYLESVQVQFMSLPSYRRFPRDDEFYREFQVRDLYNFRSRSYYLRRLENYERKEIVQIVDYTIEHIMPQNENISAEWQRSLGAEWKQIHAKWLHTLGNLTLTGYNSSYSDHAFIYKRDMSHDPVKSLRNSPLRLNQGLGQLDAWNEQTIQARAQRLADIGLKVWFAPSISEQLILTYTKKRVRQEYTVDQYPSLMSNKLRPLYDEFRRAVLDLDSMMTEEFLKHYIAYKAETNVVDLIPLTKTIKVVLNIRFSEINDPHGKCRDISNIGSLGNGEVEIIFDQIQDIPYIIGLVRQVVERQLGAEE